MPKERKHTVLSPAVFVTVSVLCVLMLLTDLSALILAASDIRATEAAYAVYGISAAIPAASVFFLIFYRKQLKSVVTDALVSTKLVARLRKFDAFERALKDYGWRTSLTALAVLACNIVYVSYLIWMAVGTYPPREISDVVVNAVFAAVKCVSAIS